MIHHATYVCRAFASPSCAYVQGKRWMCCISEQAKLCVSVHQQAGMGADKATVELSIYMCEIMKGSAVIWKTIFWFSISSKSALTGSPDGSHHTMGARSVSLLICNASEKKCWQAGRLCEVLFANRMECNECCATQSQPPSNVPWCVFPCTLAGLVSHSCCEDHVKACSIHSACGKPRLLKSK